MIATERIPTMDEIFGRYGEALKERGNGKLKPGQKRSVMAHKFWSKQRNAKKKGFSVELEYVPEPQFTDCLADLPRISPVDAYNIFVKFTIYNETLEDKYYAKEASHYISLRELDELFRLVNVIKENSLFDYYMEGQDKRRNAVSEPTAALIAIRKQCFREQEQIMCSDSCFEFDPEEQKPKMFSMLSVSYKHKDQLGNLAKNSWQLNCIRMPYVVNEGFEDEDFIEESAFEKREMVWDSEKLTQTCVRISVDHLVEAVDGIYQKLCCWLEELIKTS